MNKNLGNLDETLNQTVLKNIRFDQKNKDTVFRMIDSKEKRKDSFFKRILTPFLGIAVPISFLIVLLSFYGVDLDSNKYNQENNNASISNKESKENSSSIYKPEPKKEMYADMTKEQVLEKLLNTKEYFTSAKGRFEEFNTSFGQFGVEYQIINNGKNSIGYNKIYKPIEVPFESTYFNKDTQWKVNEKKRTYSSELNNENSTLEELMGLAEDSLFPSEFVNKFMGDISNWNIEEQNVKLNGHNTIVIQGKLDENSRKLLQSNRYRIWVDKDSGILVQYETYRDDNVIVNYLYTKELRINDPIKRTSLQPFLKGFTKQNP